ncbi:hypothetical protein EJ05DRAFT_471861 [Pseudovirgaria hyperparasitica]|uniref:BTB domain-containing protein n=1 Tax=Pseudovirgaria hyperparasitica TaxID=470096 RepID=A0A6A6WL18_9PEZI|nr:uncharacterized protein EJ05DRAFT_471861 [Pseudovirgaria hyperparasitica]KAF2762895.1 hypothetical protein EJ05DRAFT_471861 [Pseudovirgaria hyperparasitica]
MAPSDDGFGQLLETGEYSDCIIVCIGPEVNYEFRTHKSVVCCQSPVLRAAFNRSSMENSPDTILIEDYDLTTVAHMMDFLYKKSYSVNVTDVDDKDISNKLIQHIRVNAIAECYKIEQLKSLASSQFHSLLESSFTITGLAHVITELSAINETSMKADLASALSKNPANAVKYLSAQRGKVDELWFYVLLCFGLEHGAIQSHLDKTQAMLSHEETEMENVRSKLSEVMTELSDAKVELSSTKTELSDLKTLYHVTQSQLQRLEAALLTKETQLSTTNAGLAHSKNDLSNVEILHSRELTKVKAQLANVKVELANTTAKPTRQNASRQGLTANQKDELADFKACVKKVNDTNECRHCGESFKWRVDGALNLRCGACTTRN